MKLDIAKLISFRFKFFRFRFVSVFRIFFVSVFVSVNGMKIFPLTDISVSVSVNVNHTDRNGLYRNEHIPNWPYPFSAAALVYIDRHNRLLPERAEMLLFIRHNIKFE